MGDLLGLIGTALGILGACAAGIRWLISVYYKKESELAKAKHTLVQSEIRDLDNALKEVKATINRHADVISTMKTSIDKAYMRYDAQVDSIQALKQDFKEIQRELKSDFKAMQTQIIQLGQDVTLYKSRKS